MKREEAIKILKAKIDTMEDGAICCNYGNDKEVFEMAIKALEKEPCEDAISKQAVLNLFNKSDMRSWAMSLLKRKIEEMPPVNQVACIAEIKFSKEDMQKLVNEKIKEITPTRKKGKWIETKRPNGLNGFKCSNCGTFYPLPDGLNYCPNCGAEMESEDDSN